MKGLLFFAGLLAIGLASMVTATTMDAADEGTSHDGTVVSTAPAKLTMKDDSGKEHSHDIGAAVKITVNGKLGKLEDLQTGMRIRVTADKDGNVLSVSTIDTKK